jgi:long-chain acyl-CoA synthetase
MIENSRRRYVVRPPNLASYFENAAFAHPSKTALIFEGEGSWTFRQVDEAANRVANGLVDLGVEKGDRVTVFLPNCPEFFPWFFGPMKMGAVVNPLNIMLKERELDYILDDCEPTVVVTAREKAGEMLKVISSRPDGKVKKIIIVGGAEGANILNYESWAAGQSKEFSAIQVDEGDLAAILYTSGTTGRPKGAMLTHANLWTNARYCADWAETTCKDVGVSSLPLFHIYAISHVFGELWMEAGTMVWHRRFDATALLESMVNHHATCFHGVATMYHAFLNHPALDDYARGITLRYCVTGAAVTPEPITKAWNARFGSICEGYGSTEAAGSVCVNPLPGKGVQKCASCGIPMVPEMEMKIVDQDGRPVKQGEAGELLLRAPSIMQGYWRNPDATAKVLRDGWYYSGDIAYFDEDGYYYIKDRRNDMIIRSAFNIYPKEIEDLLYTHDAVAEAQVVGVPDLAKGEEVVACVAFRSGTALTEQEVIDYCRKNLAAYKVPRYVKIFDALPKTVTGKLEKVSLRRMLENEFGKAY